MTDKSNDPKAAIITEISESEFATFKTLWTYMDKRSYLSGLFLREFFNTPYFLSMFAHVLPKAKNKFPHFKYYLRNIVLLTPSEHALLDQGTEDQRESYSKQVDTANWDRIDTLRADLLAEYNSLFPKRQGLMIMKYNEEDVRIVIKRLNAIFLTMMMAGSVRHSPDNPEKKPNG